MLHTPRGKNTTNTSDLVWNHSCTAIRAKSQTWTFASEILTNTFMNSLYESVFQNNTDTSKQNSWADTKSCWILKICRATEWKICSRWSVRGWQSPQHQSDIVSGLLTNTWIRTRSSASTPLNPFIPLSSTDFSIPLHHENRAKTQNEREKKKFPAVWSSTKGNSNLLSTRMKLDQPDR